MDRFRRRLNFKCGTFARYSYAAFLVHPIIVVGIQIPVEEWRAEAAMKTFVVGFRGVVSSWSVAWAMLRNQILLEYTPQIMYYKAKVVARSRTIIISCRIRLNSSNTSTDFNCVL
jgi:multisubunit Na+/H+ antiporter MnhE subunit